MLNIISAVLAMCAVLVLLSDRRLTVAYVLKFFGLVFAAAAMLILLNLMCGFLFTDFFGLAAAVFIVLTIKYARGMKFRRIMLKKSRDHKDGGKNRAA